MEMAYKRKLEQRGSQLVSIYHGLRNQNVNEVDVLIDPFTNSLGIS